LILLASKGVFCKPTPFFEVREVCKISLKTKNHSTEYSYKFIIIPARIIEYIVECQFVVCKPPGFFVWVGGLQIHTIIRQINTSHLFIITRRQSI